MVLQVALQTHSTQAVMRAHADPKEDIARCGARHPPVSERTTYNTRRVRACACRTRCSAVWKIK